MRRESEIPLSCIFIIYFLSRRGALEIYVYIHVRRVRSVFSRCNAAQTISKNANVPPKRESRTFGDDCVCILIHNIYIYLQREGEKYTRQETLLSAFTCIYTLQKSFTRCITVIIKKKK